MCTNIQFYNHFSQLGPAVSVWCPSDTSVNATSPGKHRPFFIILFMKCPPAVDSFALVSGLFKEPKKFNCVSVVNIQKHAQDLVVLKPSLWLV